MTNLNAATAVIPPNLGCPGASYVAPLYHPAPSMIVGMPCIAEFWLHKLIRIAVAVKSMQVLGTEPLGNSATSTPINYALAEQPLTAKGLIVIVAKPALNRKSLTFQTLT